MLEIVVVAVAKRQPPPLSKVVVNGSSMPRMLDTPTSSEMVSTQAVGDSRDTVAVLEKVDVAVAKTQVPALCSVVVNGTS